MDITILGIDLAKSHFAVCGMDRRGQVVLRRELGRAGLLRLLHQLKPCVVAMEACGGAHHWGRAINAMGHQARLLPPHYVTPYRKGDKYDASDAEAVCEGAGRPTMRLVAVKTIAEQDVDALHSVRRLLMRQRTALSNQIRALLRERGVNVGCGMARLRRAVAEVMEGGEGGEGSAALRQLLGELAARLREFERELEGYDRRLEQLAKADENCRRILPIEGIGPMISTALVAKVGNARQFASGRRLASYLGLVPGEHSSGGKRGARGLTKRGDRYLRTLLIHGARAAFRASINKSDPRSRWVQQRAARRGRNVAIVALANKNVRIAWALLSRAETYRRPTAPPPTTRLALRPEVVPGPNDRVAAATHGLPQPLTTGAHRLAGRKNCRPARGTAQAGLEPIAEQQQKRFSPALKRQLGGRDEKPSKTKTQA